MNEQKMLVSISQSLALQTMKQILDSGSFKELCSEFKKNPNKFITLEEFFNEGDRIVSKTLRGIHDTSKLNKFQKLTSLLEDNLISAKKVALEEGVEIKNGIAIDRNSVVGRHVLTYTSIIEVPDNEAEYFPPFTSEISRSVSEINMKSEVVAKTLGKATVKVEAEGLDEIKLKANELVKTLEKANSLENELANININFNTN